MFTTIETIQIIAEQESKTAIFKTSSSIDASAILVENEGIFTVYISLGSTASVPTDVPSSGSIPVMPMQSKAISKTSGTSLVSFITSSGQSKVNISTGQNV